MDLNLKHIHHAHWHFRVILAVYAPLCPLSTGHSSLSPVWKSSSCDR